MADGQPARSGREEISSTGSSSALLQSDQGSDESLEADLPTTRMATSDLHVQDDPEAWVVTPSANPSTGQVVDMDQRHITQASGHLSERELIQMAGDCQLEASTGHVTIHAPGTSGVVKGMEQHVYKAPVTHNHFYFIPPTQAAFDAVCQGRAPQLPECSAQSALPPPASSPAGAGLALLETPPPPERPGLSPHPTRLAPPETPPSPKRPRLSPHPAQRQATATVPQLPAAQAAPVAVVTPPEERGVSQAASESNQPAEPQGTSSGVDVTASQQWSLSSSLPSPQPSCTRTEAEAASGEQGRASAPGQRPDSVSLPERGVSQAASESNQPAEPQGTSSGVDVTASQQSSSSSSLPCPQPPWTRTDAEDASGEQGRASGPGQRPDPVSLPEESLKLKNLIANTRQLMATHCPQGYVETSALGEVLEGLQQQGVCLVLGLPGHGKTALALQAMGSLAASHNLQPVRLDSPEQWRWIPGETEPDTTQAQQQRPQRRPLLRGEREPRDCNEDASQRSRRYVVFIDDVFGMGNYNEARRDGCGDIFDLMLAKVRAGQVKLIFVSRAHIFQACKEGLSEHSLFSEACKIDLRKPEYWTDEENEEILLQFLSQHDVQLPTSVDDIVDAAVKCTEIGFPQCCRYFATNPDAQKEGFKFFKHPVSFLQKQLKILHEKDARSYVVLVLTWLAGDCLSAQKAAADHAKLRDVCRQFGLKEELTSTEMEATARNLCGVYLNEVEDGVFKLTHNSLHDCLVVAVCKADLKRVLEVCSVQQLCEYVHTKCSSGGHAGLTYIVRRTQWPLLAATLVQAMTSEEAAEAVRHPSLRDKEFVSELVAKHLDPSQRLQLLQTKVYSMELLKGITFLATLIEHGIRDLANYLLVSKEVTQLSEEDGSTLLRDALVSACSVGDSAMVTHLLDRKAQVTRNTLRAACECRSNDVDTLRALCHHLSSFDLEHEVYNALLLDCCVEGKLQSVQYLLTDARPQDCQDCLDNVITELIIKTHPFRTWRVLPVNMALILSELKSAGANISKQRIDLWTAAGHPDSFALKELLSDNTSLEEMYNTEKGNLLHESARGGSLKCLQFLLESPWTRCLDVNALDAKKRSPLHRALKGNHVGVAEFLLQHGADPDGGVGLRGRSDVGNSSKSCNADDSLDATHTVRHDSQAVCEGTTPLQRAARHHHLSLMELLIIHKARTDVLNKNKRTPLHEYANRPGLSTRTESKPEQESLRQRVESLIVEKTHNINHQDKDGATALHLAAQNGCLSLVETLVAHKAKTDVKDKQQRTALHAFASSTDNSWEAKARKKTTACLVAASVDINQGDEEGMTPLHVAAEHDNLSTMEVLLEVGARLDSVDRHKRSVLHAYLDRPCCCKVRLSERRRRVEEALLASMPDIDSADVEGRTALHAAARCEHVTLMEKLVQRNCRMDVQDVRGKTPIYFYAMSGGHQNTQTKRWSTVTQRMEKLLIEATVEGGRGINTQDDSGQTVLHVAASSHHWTLIESLLQHGARVNVLDENGQTPVHCYAENAYRSYFTVDSNLKERVEKLLVKSLSEVGDINQQDKNGYSVLHLACRMRHMNLPELLIQHGARVDLLDRHERTPLHWYADIECSPGENTEQKLRVEELMVQKMPGEGKVDINTQDAQGSTILHLATREKNASLMEMLMERHARCDLLDQRKMSALHCCALCGVFFSLFSKNERMVQWLVDSSDVTAEADCGCTPLDIARQWSSNIFLVRALEARIASKTGHNADEKSRLKQMYCSHGNFPDLKMAPVCQSQWCAAFKYPQAITVTCRKCCKSIKRRRGQRDDDASSVAQDRFPEDLDSSLDGNADWDSSSLESSADWDSSTE